MRPQQHAPAGPFLAVGGMAVVAFLYGYTAIAAPGPLTSILLPLVWLALFVLACLWFVPRPRAVVALPVVALVVWFAVLLVAART